MDRCKALRAQPYPVTHANTVLYSFAAGQDTQTCLRVFDQDGISYIARQIGSVPESPQLIVVHVWGRGSWTAFLSKSTTKEHGVFKGWSHAQVSHAWTACGGETLIDYHVIKLLRQILHQHYPPERLGRITWRSTEDVMRMIDANNQRQSPCTLFWKRPFMCANKRATDKELNRYLLGLRDTYTKLETVRRITDGY